MNKTDQRADRLQDRKIEALEAKNQKLLLALQAVLDNSNDRGDIYLSYCGNVVIEIKAAIEYNKRGNLLKP